MLSNLLTLAVTILILSRHSDGFLLRLLSATTRIVPLARLPLSTPWSPLKLPDPALWPTFRNRTLDNVQKDFQELNYRQKVNPIVRPSLLARLTAWALRKIVRTHTENLNGLDLRVQAKSNQDVIRGKLEAIDMKFEKLSFQGLHVSGGGRLLLKGVELRMRRFLFQNLQCMRKPYVIFADLLFTQHDIINSKVIRNLIQLLVNTILERVFLTNKILSASIRKVTINARRINASGTANLLSDRPNDSGLASVDFEVSTGVAIKDNGQTLYLRDIQVAINPDSILRTVMPILTTAPIDIDLGDDCRIESLVIANKNIWIRMASVISPVEPFSVAEVKSKALYRYDLAAFFSSLLWLNGGMAMKWL